MDDLISRQAAIDAFNTNIDELVVSGKENADEVERYLNRVIDEIKQLPPIQPRRKKRKIGKWIYAWGDWDFETCKCSKCGNHITTPIGKRYSFCPNCGAKMRGEQDG